MAKEHRWRGRKSQGGSLANGKQKTVLEGKRHLHGTKRSLGPSSVLQKSQRDDGYFES